MPSWRLLAFVSGLAFPVALEPAAGQSDSRHDRSPGIQVVRQAAGVSSIEITSDPGSDGYYTRGDVIEVTVTFDESVTVDTSDGTPSLALTVGDETRQAEYDRGSGSTELVFGHRLTWSFDPQDVADLLTGNLGLSVTAGEEDEDGVSVQVGTIALNGGTIKNGSNEDADLAYPELTAQSGHKVDSVSPGLLLDPVVNGDTLTLVYREDFDSRPLPRSSPTTTIRVRWRWVTRTRTA